MGRNKNNRGPKRNKKQRQPRNSSRGAVQQANNRIGPRGNGTGGLTKATPEQVLGAKLIQEKNLRVKDLNTISVLQHRNSVLARQLADCQSDLAAQTKSIATQQINNLNIASNNIFPTVDLESGDSVTDQVEGHIGEWFVRKNSDHHQPPKKRRREPEPEVDEYEDGHDDDEYDEYDNDYDDETNAEVEEYEDEDAVENEDDYEEVAEEVVERPQRRRSKKPNNNKAQNAAPKAKKAKAASKDA